jgi:hypothetical protein
MIARQIVNFTVNAAKGISICRINTSLVLTLRLHQFKELVIYNICALARGVAFVPELWMRGLRARIVDAWPSCLICVVGHWANIFLAGFGNLPVQGRFCRNFVLIVLFFCFAEQDLSEGTRSTSACLHRHPRYNWALSLPLSYVDRCSPVRRLPSETDTVGDMRIFVYLYDCICFGLSTFFGQPTDA